MNWVYKNVFICLFLSEEYSSMKGRSQDLPLKSHTAVRTNSSKPRRNKEITVST